MVHSPNANGSAGAMLARATVPCGLMTLNGDLMTLNSDVMTWKIDLAHSE
jgi:hypothetical protein